MMYYGWSKIVKILVISVFIVNVIFFGFRFLIVWVGVMIFVFILIVKEESMIMIVFKKMIKGGNLVIKVIGF